ncbi:MAG: choice-of-anchor D domain-containing protein [Deltaproteobacteria bacterium]|nr:choice-of-anchor D domain-containing protein [Deltaproteobacteria bacterium]
MRFHRALALSLPLVAACSCEGDPGIKSVAGKLTLSAEHIDFGEVPVGDLRARGLTLANEGETPVDITKLELSSPTGEITIATEVPARLGPTQRVELSLLYQPIDLGEDLGSITVEGSDEEGPKTVTLRGVGVKGGAAVSHDGQACGQTPDSLSFGAVGPGQTATHTITIQNAGNAPFKVLSAVREPGTTTEFSIDDVAAGGSTIEPGQQLQLAARYAPADGGADSGAFVITTDLLERPSVRIPVCGEGIAPAICARPVPLDFGAVAQGTTARQMLTLESCGAEALELSGVALSSDAAHPTDASLSITQNVTVPQTLQPGATVALEISFDASTIGAVQGWVEARSNALGSATAYFPIVARAAQPCSIFVAPQTVSFSNVAQGSTSQQSVLVANDGASSCTITRLEITVGASEFRLGSATAATPITLAAGGSIPVTVEYTAPAAPGPNNGTLEIEGNGTVFPVALIGNPVLTDGCQLEVVPTAVSFGGVAPNSTRSMPVNVNNLSSDFCTIRSVELAPSSDPAFINTSSNFGLVLPGRSKQLSVTFQPTLSGSARGELIITTTDVDTPEFRVPLFASSLQSAICINPRILPFGPATGVETMDFIVTACGTTPVTVTQLDWTTPDAEFGVAVAPALPFTLQPGQNQPVTIRYSPADQQGDYAVVTVRSNDLVDPAINVEMTGGPEIVPTEAGRFLYYWQILPLGGDVMKLPLQGATNAISFWGPRSGKSCTGCHHVSPDGRYVALIEFAGGPYMKIIDTASNVTLQLPAELRTTVSYFSWRPNVNTNPAYQFAYDSPDASNGQYKVHIGSVFGGYLRELQGANDPAFSFVMPAWGPSGKIAVVRGMMATQSQGGAAGLTGPTDILLVDENGGNAAPLAGASGNGANYYPSYAPNGNWIAYTFSASAQGTIAASDAQVRMIAPTGGSALPLSSANGSGGASSYPTWSVNGQYLSFSSNRPGGAGDWDIYLSTIDPATGADGAAQNLSQANSANFEHAAQWSP